MLLPVNRLAQQSVVRYLAPLVSSFTNHRLATGCQNDLNFASPRHLSTSNFAMSSSKFSVSDKYKGLEKNVWYMIFLQHNFFPFPCGKLFFILGLNLLI